MSRWTIPVLLFLSGLYLPHASAQSFNVTVDDQFGPYPRVGESITYSQGNWVDVGFGLNGLSRTSPTTAGFEGAVNGTWKRSVYSRGGTYGPPSAKLKFKGTAVYVSCILNDIATRTPANLEMIFTIDDGPPINVSRPARPTKPAVIITVFQQENLTPGEHTLTLQNGRDDEGVYNTTVTFLDAIIYTSSNELLGISEPNNDTNNNSSNTTATIAAAVSVSAFAVVFALVGLWAWRRRQHRQRIAPLESPSASTPFMTTFPPPPTPFPPPSSSGSDSDWQSTRPTLSKQAIHTSAGSSSYAPSQVEQSTLNRPV